MANKIIMILFVILMISGLTGCEKTTYKDRQLTKTANKEKDIDISNKIGNVNAIMIVSTSYIDSNADVKVRIFDLFSKKNLKTTEFVSKNNINPGDMEAMGANSSFQQSKFNGEYYFLTNASNDMTGECMNDDGSCDARIYKFSLNNKKPQIEYSIPSTKTKEGKSVTNWIMLNTQKGILVGSYYNRKYTIQKIKDNRVIYTITDDFGKDDFPSYGQFVVSQDDKFLYQTVFSSKTKELKLRVMNVVDGSQNFEKIPLKYTTWVSTETNISPDNNKLAFYAGELSPKEINIYDRNTKEVQTINLPQKVHNANITWSSDSKNIFVLASDDLIVNIKNKSMTVLSKKMSSKGYIYNWLPSEQGIVCEDDNNMTVHDLKNNQIKQLFNVGDENIISVKAIEYKS